MAGCELQIVKPLLAESTSPTFSCETSRAGYAALKHHGFAEMNPMTPDGRYFVVKESYGGAPTHP